MRISKSKTGEHFIVEGLGEAELELLRRVRKAGDPTACAEAEKRLFPEPITDADTDDLDAIADWKEFVVPDLRTQFDNAIDLLEQDLAEVEQVRKRPTKRYRVTIPVGHLDQWYSALNQARLVLQEKYRLPGENDGLSLEDLFARGQWRAYFQSRFYAELQCWILEIGMAED